DLRHGYGHTLRYLGAARAAITSKQRFFPTCYGPEFIAQAVRDWIAAVGAKTAYIEPGSPWENGYCESFNARFRDELLDGEVFYSLREAQIIIEEWRKHYNTKRPHSALGYRPPGTCRRAQRLHCARRPRHGSRGITLSGEGKTLALRRFVQHV
ncbi:integrase core domain-containing protein, partial [Paracoccus lutimaris]